MKKLLSILFLVAVCLAGQAAPNVYFDLKRWDGTAEYFRTSTNRLKITPVSAPFICGGSIVGKDPIEFLPSTNGTLTVTNICPEQRYLCAIKIKSLETSFFIEPYDTNGTIDAWTIVRTPTNSPTTGVGYSYPASVSDGRFIRRNAGYTNGQVPVFNASLNDFFAGNAGSSADATIVQLNSASNVLQVQITANKTALVVVSNNFLSVSNAHVSLSNQFTTLKADWLNLSNNYVGTSNLVFSLNFNFGVVSNNFLTLSNNFVAVSNAHRVVSNDVANLKTLQKNYLPGSNITFTTNNVTNVTVAATGGGGTSGITTNGGSGTNNFLVGPTITNAPSIHTTGTVTAATIAATTFSADTFNASTFNLTNALGAASGGLGTNQPGTNTIAIFNGTNTPTFLPPGTSGQVLKMSGSTPAWGTDNTGGGGGGSSLGTTNIIVSSTNAVVWDLSLWSRANFLLLTNANIVTTNSTTFTNGQMIAALQQDTNGNRVVQSFRNAGGIVHGTNFNLAVTTNANALDLWTVYPGLFPTNIAVYPGNDTAVATLQTSVAANTAILGAVTNIITASATLNFPSIVANTEAELTVAITGAAVGDVISLGMPAGSMDVGMSYTTWVGSANSVQVRAHNHTGSSIDPASGTFKFVVFKF